MKTMLFITFAVFLTVLTNAQIQMNCNGNVGIKSSPSSSYSLNVSGTTYLQSVRVTGTFTYSPADEDLIFDQVYGYGRIRPEDDNSCYLGYYDKRYSEIWTYHLNQQSDYRQKENIRDIPNALDLVLKLKGVKYDLKKEFAYNETLIKDEKLKTKLESERKDQLGFLAQDVNEILPEVVSYDDSTDNYGLYYNEIIPVLVEAIKEQQVIIESLQLEIKSVKLKSTSTVREPNEINIDKESILYQNSPNPFTEATKIEYYLTDNIQNAMINMYDMNGEQLKSIPLHLLGYGNITILGSELKAGMYMYTMIADGQVVDTKEMILTD